MMRVITRKRPAFMTPHRWIFVITATILLLGTAFGVYFREIQMPEWTAESEAERRAVDEAGLAVADRVYHHIWHQESWIVEGIDKTDNDVFVWITEGKPPKVIAEDDGVSLRQLKNTFLVEQPDAKLKRIQPGLFDGGPVWEIFYSIGEKPERYYYDFYTFDSGTFIDRYRLPSKTEP
ncbi:DUF5590 domain-containing protein [Paenibacillus sp. N4]|uniref:DUF5590 domain-containing protein n=1 Tax=Paenibacillus vietnamensis TaxID=2590547 RepID=UPI001CD1235D|nr:DUF5590 domain-containing protein [Paenibacillus vietnamensis]MCA0754372.1 DUF5590 domain-containing protein [Paenibacillus vietnamensis]